jgi:hypothetical protein
MSGHIRLKLDREALAPGEELLGAFAVEAAEGDELRTLELSVLWYTEGKGDEDLGVVHFEEWPRGEGFDLTRPYAFVAKLPRTPLSYDGEIVKIHWAVRVRARWEGAKESLEECAFRLGEVSA